MSGIGYSAAGQVIALTLGNGVIETYGYDANRLQLTSQTATKNGGPQNGLMNLTYGYQASAGQMGAATTSGNAGQLMSISGSINGTTESAAYTYDNLGRLVTSNQSANGSSAQRRFAFDRWGNRTGVWDAVSGGNQIQGITLRQSGGAPTNQIQSVTSGSTVNYTYDAAGNVTNDGLHSYQYDAANRVVNVDGGSTAEYRLLNMDMISTTEDIRKPLEVP
jgi:YD repeat-containing protein